MCARVCEKEGGREKGGGGGGSQRSIVSVCVRGRHGHTTAVCLQTHMSITVSVMRLCSTLGLELMVKLRTLLTVFTFILKAKARDYGKGHYNQSRLRLSEGGTLKKMKRLREVGHRGPTILYSILKIYIFFFIKACQHILLYKIMIFKKASYNPFKTRPRPPKTALLSMPPHVYVTVWVDLPNTSQVYMQRKKA